MRAAFLLSRNPDRHQSQTEKGQPLSPEKRIADLATDIKKSGLTTGKATIAAQELYQASRQYGPNSEAMLNTYHPGQDPKRFASGFQNAYILGTQGNQTALQNSKAAAYLTQEQKQIAYELGVQSTTQDSTEQAGYMPEEDMPEDRYSLQNTVENNGESATIVDENAKIHEDKLMAMPIPQRATIIENILGQYTDKKSKQIFLAERKSGCTN